MLRRLKIDLDFSADRMALPRPSAALVDIVNEEDLVEQFRIEVWRHQPPDMLSPLPFGETSILMPPHRVAPTVALLGSFSDIFFVHLNAKTRALRYRYEAIVVVEDLRI